ncbi:hypothetical protein MHH28_29690 [Paenibacillus sp. FSL K6-1217]|uniref:hypothetical protein n=1 Tax=Paenibacillus sp. FSL K6-1217 TaxID=2921466 RepID=UPI0032513C85
MKRFRWSIAVYFVLFVFVLFVLFNDYSPILIVVGAVAVQATYKAAYGWYRKDMAAVQEAVPYIRHADYRAYYEAALLLEGGESARAREHLRSIRKPWMRLVVLAEIERKAGNSELAVKYAREAVEASRGVQRYVLYKEYERTLPQAVEA